MYETFRRYQADLLAEFDHLSLEYNFRTIDASSDVRTVFRALQTSIQHILDKDSKAARPSGLLQLARPAGSATEMQPSPWEAAG
jgi:hypothetical protein